MNWNEQAQSMMKSWTETQKKLWEGWGGGAAPAAASDASWSEWVDQWQSAARESLRQWTAGAQGVPRAVAERLVGGEGAFLRFVDLALGAFGEAAPKLQAGENWAASLRRWVDQIKREMTRTPAPWLTPEAAAAVARDVPELWKLFQTQLQNLGLPWARSLQDARGHLGDAMSGDRQASVKMYNLFMDTFENTLGKFVAAPAIGYTREFQEKLARAFETWLDVRRAEVEFQTEIVNTGIRSLEGLVQELADRADRGETVSSYRELFDLWVATSERIYAEIAIGPEFAALQARLVNAAMLYRIHERELADEFANALHLPTRRELDDAYRHLNDLRKQVKGLKRELAALRARPEPAPAEPAPRRPGPRARKTPASAGAAGEEIAPRTARPRTRRKKEG